MAESFIINLPNVLEISKSFPFSINPHCDEDLINEAKAWILQYAGQQYAHLFQDDLNLYCAYVYPKIDREQLKLVVDYNNYMWLTEEFTERSDEIETKFSKTVLKVLEDVNGEVDDVIGAATKE